MSIDDSPVYAERALEAGASGCVSKQELEREGALGHPRRARCGAPSPVRGEGR